MSALDQLASWPVGAVAGGVIVGPPRVDVPRLHAAFGSLKEPFAWASVSKLCSTLGALVALEEGSITLATPAGPQGSTVSHLLAHASGLGLADPEPVRAPEQRRIYSNIGFEMLADVVAAGTDVPFVDYLHEAVFEPLGMSGARLSIGMSPASGITGTIDDLLALARELMAPHIIATDTLTTACTVAFAGLDGLLPGFGIQRPCDWGLGFELRSSKRPHWTAPSNSAETFGHFGQAGGFLWVDPIAGAACAVLSDRPFGQWAREVWPILSESVLGELEAEYGPANV
jgi:CubicO group peptidase (beta-lactamase class C family)